MSTTDSTSSGFRSLFPNKALIGMVHLMPLPGCAMGGEPLQQTLEAAVADAIALEQGGCAGIMVENFFDSPFHSTSVPPITIAAMTVCLREIVQQAHIPVGVNVLRNDIVSAISIAHATGAKFVRCNVFVGAAITDQGMIQGAAREAIALRHSLGANVCILADVEVKHAVQIGSPSVQDQVRDAIHRGRADAIIVTGAGTGQETPIERLRTARDNAGEHPILAGSGVDESNIANVLALTDGVIVGSSLKRQGKVEEAVDIERVKAIARFFA